MSEQDQKVPEQEADTDTAPVIEKELAALAAESETAPASSGPAKAGISKVGLLALLGVLALGGGAYWQYLELQKKETALEDRLKLLEDRSADRKDNLDDRLKALDNGLQTQLEQGIAGVKQSISAATGPLQKSLREQAQKIQQAQASLARQREELARYSSSDRESWLLAEAEYLLRLANQRLVMAGDTVSAAALLKSADGILLQLDDASLHSARAALANDIAALNAVPKLDIEGMYLRLSAMIEQADNLVIFELAEAQEQLAEAPADTWQQRLQQGYEAAWDKISNYIVIRRRDVPMQALMDPQWEGLVRQNLRMLLEQAQVALLSGNQVLFEESLKRSRYWVAEFFEADESAARALDREIEQISAQPVSVDLPDLSRSLRALDIAAQRRQAQGDEDA